MILIQGSEVGGRTQGSASRNSLAVLFGQKAILVSASPGLDLLSDQSFAYPAHTGEVKGSPKERSEC